MKKKTLLVDADIVVYQTACRNEESYDWGDGVVSTRLHFSQALNQLEEQMGKLLEATGCKDLLCCFSSSPNFRHTVLESYKANRKDKPKPALFSALYTHCWEAFPCKVKPNLEADDVLGVLVTQSPSKYVIATIDKDLKQIPGHHYNWNTEQLFIVTEEEGNHQFYTQVLTGDSTDNYKGCPGIGAVKAEKILTPQEGHTYYEGWQWDVIVEAYGNKGLTPEDALVQARMARILRASDYDFKNKKVKLWNPPTKR